MLVVSTWLWGSKRKDGPKYGVGHVNRLRRAVARNLQTEHRFFVVAERELDLTGLDPEIERHAIKDPELLRERDGCYARLRMFDPGWQIARGIDGHIACLDLDLVVVGGLDPLFAKRDETFIIVHGGHYNPCPFNGSVMLLRSGSHAEVWRDFNVREAREIAFADGTDRGTDQTWIAHKLPKAAGFRYDKDGVYAFGKPGWPKGENLPTNARIVAFPGARDPSQYERLGWVRDNWK